MNAITPFAVELPQPAFVDACRRVNEWRGRCIDALTRAEEAVTNSLIVLAEVPDRGLKVELPHLLGQRYEALSQAIGTDGPFAGEGIVAFQSLEAFRTHSTFRCELCHGVGKVALDRNNRWVLVLRTTSLRSSRVEKTVLVVEEAEAGRMMEDIVRQSRDLCGKLGMLRRALG